MTRQTRITDTLTRVFAPLALDVRDTSASHAGHAGASPNGETHYDVTLVSAAFAYKSRIDRHRLVNQTLLPEFETGLHALRLNLSAPE